MPAKRNNRDMTEDPILKELRNIRNLLVVLLIKAGASSEEVDFGLHMGAGNLRALFPFGKIKRGLS